MRKRIVSCTLPVLAALCLPEVVDAQTWYVTRDTTFNTFLPYSVYVGKDAQNRNYSPTLSIVSGADIGGAIVAFNSSKINMSGGRVRAQVVVLDTSTLRISGGEVQGSLVTGQEGYVGSDPIPGGTIEMSGGVCSSNAILDYGGLLSMTGGTINGPVTLKRGSNLFMNQGSIHGGVRAELDTGVYINGGIIFDSLYAIRNATVGIDGGIIYDGVHASGSSKINVGGGDVGHIYADQAGTIKMSGGFGKNLSARQNGSFILTGGGVDSLSTDDGGIGIMRNGVVGKDVIAFDGGTIYIYGGTIYGELKAFGTIKVFGGNKFGQNSLGLGPLSSFSDLYALDEGLIELNGSGISASLLDPNLLLDVDGVSGYFSRYGLGGFLSDGTSLVGTSLFVQNGTGAGFELINQSTPQVPEPGGVALLAGIAAFGTAFAARRYRTPVRRKRTN